MHLYSWSWGVLRFGSVPAIDRTIVLFYLAPNESGQRRFQTLHHVAAALDFRGLTLTRTAERDRVDFGMQRADCAQSNERIPIGGKHVFTVEPVHLAGRSGTTIERATPPTTGYHSVQFDG